MTATLLKTIAVIAMVIDHIAGGLMDYNTLSAQVMHGIGRLTFPIMAYFIAEGFNKTSNVKAYIKRIGIFAIITHIPFRFFLFGIENIFGGFETSIMYTFLISLLILYVLENTEMNKLMKSVLVAILFGLSIWGDYDIFGPLLVLAFHKGYGNRTKQILYGSFVILWLVISSLISTNFEYLTMVATFIPLLLLYYYNGNRGKSGKFIKYSFYIVYPLQFIILGLLKY